jgi:hypothetical protein
MNLISKIKTSWDQMATCLKKYQKNNNELWKEMRAEIIQTTKQSVLKNEKDIENQIETF